MQGFVETPFGARRQVLRKNALNRPKSGVGGEHAIDPCERSGTHACDRQIRFDAFFRCAEAESR